MPKSSIALCAFAAGLVTAADARAVTDRVKDACREDYYAYCAAYEVGSEALRSCMRAAQGRLSHACAKAIADSGEATPEEIRRYKARHGK